MTQTNATNGTTEKAVPLELAEAVRLFVEADDEKRAAEELLDEAKQKLREAGERAFEAFVEAGIQNVKRPDGSCVYLQRQITASLKGNSGTTERDQSVHALKRYPETAFMVKPDVNWQTLGAWVRELDVDDEGMPIVPEDVRDFINVGERKAVRRRSAP